MRAIVPRTSVLRCAVFVCRAICNQKYLSHSTLVSLSMSAENRYGGGILSYKNAYLSRSSNFNHQLGHSEFIFGRLFVALKTMRILVCRQRFFCCSEKFKLVNKAVINKVVKSFTSFLRISIKAFKLVKKAESCLLAEYAYE